MDIDPQSSFDVALILRGLVGVTTKGTYVQVSTPLVLPKAGILPPPALWGAGSQLCL